MPELTRAQKKAAEVRQRMLVAMSSLSPRHETSMTVVVEDTQDLEQKDRVILELKKQIIALEEVQSKIVTGYEQRLKQKEVTIEELQGNIHGLEEGKSKNIDSEAIIKDKKAKSCSLEAAKEEVRQLKLDLNHVQKTAEYDQKMLQEALGAADANLLSKIEENNRLQQKLVDMIKDDKAKSCSLEAAKEEVRQLKLDLNHIQKTAEYDQKMLQEALGAADANLLSKIEENNRLQQKLVDMIKDRKAKSCSLEAAKEEVRQLKLDLNHVQKTAEYDQKMLQEALGAADANLLSKIEERVDLIKDKKAKSCSLEAAKEEVRQLKLDLNHVQKTAEYDQKMLQEALGAADANLLSKIEENNRLQQKLVDMIKDDKAKSCSLEAAKEEVRQLKLDLNHIRKTAEYDQKMLQEALGAADANLLSKIEERVDLIKDRKAKSCSLEAAKEEVRQLKLDLNHVRKTAEYDQKMLQEALGAADANLLSKIEENNRLQQKLVDLRSKLRIRSQITTALSELDNEIDVLSNQHHLVVPNSYTKIYHAYDAVDVEKIKESLNRFSRDERDDFSTQGDTVEVETSMQKLVRVIACGSSLPLSAE